MNRVLREINSEDFQSVMRSKSMELVKKPQGFIWGDIVARESSEECIKAGTSFFFLLSGKIERRASEGPSVPVLASHCVSLVVRTTQTH